MGKRKRVPAALHSELSEYSSLLRALHTNDTLDVAKDITNPPKRQKPGPRAEGSSNEPPADPQSDAEQPKRKHTRKRDTWTRWPLLVTDIKVPEWGLEDEIEALMRLCLRNNPHLAVEETLDAGDTPPSLPHLAQSASNFLSSILALIALHTPARPQSMQDRLNPIGWQAVLDVLGSCGDPATVDADMITNIKTRMEAIYGPSESHAADRVKTRLAAKSRASAALDEADDMILAFARPQQRQPKRQKTVVEDDVDSDDLDS